MNSDRLEEILLSYGNPVVLVVGDYMVDEYVIGKTERISPEAPVQVVEVERESRVPGGAGNVVRNLAVFSPQIFVAGVIGKDEPGEYLLQTFADYGTDTSAMISSTLRPTTIKSRVMVGRQQILRIDREKKSEITQEEAEEVFARIKKLPHKPDVVLLSDYGKGTLTTVLLSQLISHFSQQEIPILVDPKGNDYSRYRGVSLITPNLKEAQLATGLSTESPTFLKDAAQYLQKNCGIKSVLITRSEQGMSLFNQQEAEHHVPAQVREVFDVTGAGDTVISLMALGLGTHGNLLQSAQISNLAAGVVVGKVGSATASQGEIIAFHRQWNDQSADSKIMSPHSLRIQLDRLREMGKKIVFTNGIFDLLHIGHIQLFQKAKALGDILVVGINSDESARLLKGEGRPIISDRERASIISAIAAVDYVTIFREATPEVVLGKLRPHILAKGANYQDVEVIGREIVREYGGEVCLIPIKEQISVSDITERIREKKES